MKTLYETIAARLHAGESLLLATVLHASGSTPRSAGAQMLVFADGTTMGTVGGGAVEHETGKLGAQLLAERRSAVKTYSLTNDQVADLGMICGGRVTVALTHLPAGDLRYETLFADAAQLCGRNADGWLVFRIRADGADFELALCDGEQMRFSHSIDMAQVRPYLWNKAVYEPGETAWFCMPFAHAGRTYVFGGGHVAQKLVHLLHTVDFTVVVVDDRAEFCNAAMFPDAVDCVVAPFETALSRLSIGANDDVVIMTRGHQADYEVLEQALRTEAAYIGCIGSHHKVALTKKRLVAAGFSAEQIARLHAPIGLAIGAETPAEIAVSVAAEMIQCRAARF